MRIESFWAKGFRSLRDVRLENLGAFNVFYGPNGGGKSNILDAIRVLLQIARREPHTHERGDEECTDLTHAVISDRVVQHRDLCARDDTRTIVLGARFTNGEAGSPGIGSGPLRLADLTVECTVEWIVQSEPHVRLTRLESNGQDLHASRAPEQGSHLRALLHETLPTQAYTLISAERFLPEGSVNTAPHTGVEEFAVSRGAGEQALVSWCVRHRQLARALFIAANSPSPATHQRSEALHSLLEGPPLDRKRFRPVQDPVTTVIELRERLSDPNPDGLEIPLDLAGLGVAQIYAILAQAMLSGARTVAIEEPEAHLHAPTTGRHLRDLLLRLVNEKHIDQLFIATHSNLFDLDPTGYFDVSLKNGETVVERVNDLTRIDRDHLYEPGPAKHALRRMLEYMPPDEIMFRRGDGSPIAIAEMLRLLEEDDELAVEFLKDVHGAAVRMVKVAKKKGK